MSENPYQAPAVSEVAAPVEPLSEAAVIRQEHLRHEASIKGMGSLFFLTGAFSLLMGFSAIMGLVSSDAGMAQGPEILILSVILLFIPLQFSAWWGLRKLKPWSKVVAAILSTIGLLAFGLGTIISIYFLYLLFCKKGRMVLSPAYHEIIEQTPGMKYRTPMWNWIVLLMLVLLVIGGVVYFILIAP
ncbi:hypothetical protein [Haloferula sp.]|uniref:hypothetical protein n=1 Tax=Haloferula sp. TaxID=2497595 RepID=UPI00329F1A79